MADGVLVGPVDAPDLHVMTWNIRRRVAHLGSRNPDLWARRQPLVRRLLEAERPSLLCVQEALPEQAAWVLESVGAEYESVGTGRNADGSGEATPVLYDAQRLRLTDWSQLALSETPREAGSRSFGNLVPRAVVSASFVDRETGARFRVLNMHLDHLSAKSRVRSARLLRQLVEAAEEPVVLMGDANAGTRTEPFRILTGGGLLRDAWSVAERRLTEPWGTFSNYRPPRRGWRRIDWILASERVAVRAAGINAARFDGAAASDHEPVQAVLAIS